MEIIKTDQAPAAIGPYSQAVKSRGLVFCSGQIALNAEGELIGDGGASVVDQTHQVMKNLSAVLQAAGSGLDKVVKVTIYLVNMEDFAAVNEVYGGYFVGDVKPARATVEVSGLPKGVMLEIDCVAEL